MPNPPLTEAVYYILLSLTEPLHGYGIMQKAEQLSSGRVRLAAGTLYGALNALLEKGWIAAGAQEGRQKRYRLTPQGREALTGALDRRLRRILALLLPILALSLFAGRNGLEQMGILNLLLALFLAAGIGKLWRKIKELQAQQDSFDTRA